MNLLKRMRKMASRVFTSYVELQNAMEQCIDVALQNVAQKVKDKLKEFIEADFYRTYEPHIYKRTYQFLNSTETVKINPTTHKIFIDMSKMNYFDISPEEMVGLSSQGYHGNTSIFREGYFWKDFISWCEVNIPVLMKTELRRQGLNVR